jgi:hypothetical protein
MVFSGALVCGHGKWRSRVLELPRAWGYSRDIRPQGDKLCGLVLQVGVGRRGENPARLKYLIHYFIITDPAVFCGMSISHFIGHKKGK